MLKGTSSMAGARTICWSMTAAVLTGLVGCCCCHDKCPYPCPETPAPLGTLSDPVWQLQETNAEASDFVIHEHEFVGNTPRLNAAGQDHVKQIAARLGQVPFPVLIEPSSMSPQPGTVHGFPVHNNAALDGDRRLMIVQALSAMGAPDAESRVVIGPALTPGFESFEAEGAYQRGFSGFNSRGYFGFGGFGGFGLGGF
jgi:hypothetical protein